MRLDGSREGSSVKLQNAECTVPFLLRSPSLVAPSQFAGLRKSVGACSVGQRRKIRHCPSIVFELSPRQSAVSVITQILPCRMQTKTVEKQGKIFMGELSKLPNIGKTVEEQLNQVGINSVDELKSTGAKEAWLKIQEIDESACIHRLMALEGAIEGVKKTMLSDEVKADLKEFYQRNKR